MRPIVLTIAGSDPSGGAGIQADIKAIEASGGYGCAALTAVTVQNTLGVSGVHALPAELVGRQVDAVFSDLSVAAVKSGMLADRSIVLEVARCLTRHRPRHFVLDPVFASGGGVALLAVDARDSMVGELLPVCTLVTPNVPEAQALTGYEITGPDGAQAAGERLLELGAGAALVKGGHLVDRPGTDILVTSRGTRIYEGPFIETRHTHGTGCTYSAAIATALAFGLELEAAVERAKGFIIEAIRGGLDIGGGAGPTDPFQAAAAHRTSS